MKKATLKTYRNTFFANEKFALFSRLITVVLTMVLIVFSIDAKGQASASTNYSVQTGNVGTTYSWIDCSSESNVVTGDDQRGTITWPFDFNFYNNAYTTSNSLSVATNGFIRLDGTAASYSYSASRTYNLTSTATNFGQIISMAMSDCYVGRVGTSWVKSKVTGTAPYRILTVEYNDLSIPYYSSSNLVDVQVCFYESLNKVVLKLGNDNITYSGVDMGIHSGVSGYFNKWQEVKTGANNTWIEYTPPVKVIASAGTTEAYYSNLKGAFDQINEGKHQGAIDIYIQESVVETSAAVLNASGSGNANYASVYIRPTNTGISISGDIATPLIDLNGADNVTIDGRVNATGSTVDMLIHNASTSSASGISTIRLINDAQSNTIKYCTVKGAETKSVGGVIYFATSNSHYGNDDNIIEYNNITSSTDANRPKNIIYSEGTSGKDNSGNIIRNNNIYDFFKHSSASSGIYLSNNTTEWTIEANSFYETTSYAATSAVTFNVIKILNLSGQDFAINDNYIGGSAPLCGGSAWTKTSSANNLFYGMYIQVGNSTASSIQNNTIKNISWSNSGSADWNAINVVNGTVNIGTITGNTIGAATGTGSITVNGGTNAQDLFALKIAGSDIVTCKNNTIGSLTASTSSTLATRIYGVYISGNGTVNIEDNNIGSESTGSSINATSASSSNAQKVYGVYSNSDGVIAIHNNEIINLTNGTTNTSTGTLGVVQGIYVGDGDNTISDNTIKYLTIGNANNSNVNPSVCGIAVSGSTGVQDIHANTISDLSNTYSAFAGSITGIYVKTNLGSSAGNVNSNFIHSLTVNVASTSATLYGIYANTDEVTYYNNIINIGGTSDSEIVGIYDRAYSGKDIDLFFNTVYIGGSTTGTNKSSCVRFNTNSSNRDLRNNILFNARSGASSNHFAVYYDATGGTLTADYNDYYATGTGGVLGYYGGNQASLPIVTAQDANSLNIDPQLTSAGGTTNVDYYAAATLNGITGTSVTTEYFGVARVNPPKMGAFEAEYFIWQGGTSTDFGTAANWVNGVVPPNAADINFAANPDNNCILDQDRIVKDIVNAQSTDKLIVNGYKLTIVGDLYLTNSAKIDATTSSSIVEFGNENAQVIPDGAFVSNTVDGLTINNADGVTQNGDLIIETAFALTDGQYTIGSNTLTINGSISATTGSLLGSESTDIVIGGTGASTTLPSVDMDNLILNRANGIAISGDIHVHGLLTLTSGTLDIQGYNLLIGGDSPIRTSGNVDVSDSNSEISFENVSAIVLPTSFFSGAINDVTLTGAGGVTCVDDITVNGIMDIQIANQSTTKGALDMLDGATVKTLNMGANATNTGVGDVTGIIRRTTIVAGIIYTYGHPNTTGYFPDEGTLPSEVSAKITIGNTPSWRAGAIDREIEIIQTGGSLTKAMFTCHYLDSELNGNTENRLAFWTRYLDLEYGRSGQNSDENWVSLSNVNVAFFPSSFDDARNLTLDEFSDVTTITWNGSLSDSWTSVENWTPNSGPSAVKNIIIPDASTTPNDPTLPAVTEVKSITIEANGILNASVGAQCTVNGSGGAWINSGGTLNPNTSTVIFDNADATISGTTDFYNLIIDTGAGLTLNNSGVLRVAGSVTNNGVWHTVVGGTTIVEYNGGDQTVVIPNASTNRYHCLTLSGSGTKTLPATGLDIVGNFSIMDGVSTTAGGSLTIGDELVIDSGSSFTTGAYDHSIAGDIDNSGTFTIGSTQTITLNGTSLQSIFGTSECNFEKLTINNAAGVKLFNDVTVNDDLSLTSGTLDVNIATLTINDVIVQTSGYLDVSELSSLYFGGTTALSTSGLFVSTPELNNMTVNRTGGVTFGSNLTVNGNLYLQSANPSSTVGTLDMGSYTVTMSENATNTGGGDVTGNIKRTSFLPNIEYTFGHPNTSVTFPDIGTLPTEVTLKIDIGTASSWKPDGILRILDIAQVGGSETRGIVKSHYLESELNGNTESNISFFSYIYPSTLLDRGLSEINTSENWLTLNNANLTNIPSAFGIIEHTFGVSTSDVIEWDGSESTDWTDQYNWTPAISPDLTKKVIIPDAGTTSNDPTIANSTSTTIKTLAIHEGGVLNSGTSTQITVVGTSGVWSNYGTFNESTSKVTFSHGVVSEIATISGETDFYDIEVGANTTFQPVAGSILRISGIGSADITSVVDFSTINSTVEWNGAAQTIVNPNGIGENTGYYHLIISGSGTKTMPTTAMNINGDFETAGTVSLTAAESLIVKGSTTIGSGTTLETGNYTHYFGGDFVNNGTFTATSGSNATFNDTSSQTLSGTSTTSFYTLTIDNEYGLTISNDINISNNLNLNSGNLVVGNNILGLNGTITQSSGYIETTSSSSISIGGTAELTFNDYLFSSAPTLDNLTINRSGGVIYGLQDITVEGTLTLTAGALTVGPNSLIIAGNSPVRTSGNINLTNSQAEIDFANASAITIPSSIFTGNVNNFTISGVGGVTSSGDFTIAGILDMSASNPSSSKGALDMGVNTLDMGVNATTTGVGDVTGIIKRQHTFTDDIEYSFGNQYTTINFLGVSGSSKPSWLSCKVELGTSPIWRGTAVERVYSFAQEASGTDRVYTKLHYLESELDVSETDEAQITVWNDYDGLATGDNTFVTGKTTNSADENWIELLGMSTDFIAPSTSFAKQFALAYTDVTTITWTGLGSASYPGDWSLPGHWSGGVPTADDDVLIPASLPDGTYGYPDDNLLVAINEAVSNTVEIEAGATLDASNFDLYVYGGTDAWQNDGTFIPGNNTVYFSNGLIADTMKISGATQFNNLSITYKTNVLLLLTSDISIAGDLVCDGNIMDSIANTFTFNSSTADQTISGIGELSFYNLVMNNTFGTGELTLSAPISISNVLTLTNNTIVSDATNFITMGSSSSVSPSEGAASSYVIGPMDKVGNTSFVFPIGLDDVWAPIGIEAPATSSTITAEYYLENGPNNWSTAYMCSENDMIYTSGIEYWELSTTDAHPGVTLYWKSTGSDIADLPNLTVSHYNGTCWEDMGGTASGDASTGAISSTEIFTSYSPITFGTESRGNPLPVSLLSFEATCYGNSVLLTWATASETNNKMFEIETSLDGKDWNNITNVDGFGNSNNRLDYDYEDFSIYEGAKYYRLIQVDYDGKRSEIALDFVDCQEGIESNITIKPNPARNYITIVSNNELRNEAFTITNTMGQTLIEGTANGFETGVEIQSLKPGVYYLTLESMQKTFKLSKF